jgi:hypothetical protein
MHKRPDWQNGEFYNAMHVPISLTIKRNRHMDFFVMLTFGAPSWRDAPTARLPIPDDAD